MSGESARSTEANADEECSALERFATADASNLTAALVQKDATIKTKNAQPNEFLGSKRGCKAG